MINLFLSVSVPLPDRHLRFMETADVIAIREAVKGLVGEVIQRGTIIFGGHPAITPLMAILLRGMGQTAAKRVVLYQSAFFAGQFVQENDEFLDVRIVPAVGSSRDQSLEAMRQRMMRDTPFDAGVFIGGMEGVLDEYELFGAAYPKAPRWPIASTGAAALEIFKRESQKTPLRDKLLREMTYPTLFRELMAGLRRPK